MNIVWFIYYFFLTVKIGPILNKISVWQKFSSTLSLYKHDNVLKCCFSSTRPQLHRLRMGPHVYLDSRWINWFWKYPEGSWGHQQGWAKVGAIQRAVSLNAVECACLNNLLSSISNLLLCSMCRLCQPHTLPLFFNNEGSLMTTEYVDRKHRSLYCKIAQCWPTVRNDAKQISRLSLTLAALSNVDLWLSLKWREVVFFVL